MPLLLLLVPLASLLPCFCQSHCCHPDGWLFPSICDPELQALLPWWEGKGGGVVSWGPAGASTGSGVVRFKGSPLQMKGAGWGHVCLSGSRDRVPGPTATAAQLPVAAGTAVVRRPELCAPPPLLLLGSLKLRLSCHGQRAGITGTNSAGPSVLPLLCVSVYPPSGIQMFRIL